MVSEIIGLILIIKFFTICWMFDFIPNRSLFRKQLETTMSVGILSSVVLYVSLSESASFGNIVTSIYIVYFAFITEALMLKSLEVFKLLVQVKVLGLVEHRFDDLPHAIKEDILTLLLVTYNVIYLLVVVAVIIFV